MDSVMVAKKEAQLAALMAQWWVQTTAGTTVATSAIWMGYQMVP
jgi:hypothetical protein